VTKKQKKNAADDSGGDEGGVKVLKSGGDEPCGGQAGDNGGDEGGDECELLLVIQIYCFAASMF